MPARDRGSGSAGPRCGPRLWWVDAQWLAVEDGAEVEGAGQGGDDRDH